MDSVKRSKARCGKAEKNYAPSHTQEAGDRGDDDLRGSEVAPTSPNPGQGAMAGQGGDLSAGGSDMRSTSRPSRCEAWKKYGLGRAFPFLTSIPSCVG